MILQFPLTAFLVVRAPGGGVSHTLAAVCLIPVAI